MPRGHFKLENEDAGPLVMVSAGTGITPILSMVDCLAFSPSSLGSGYSLLRALAARSLHGVELKLQLQRLLK